MTDKLFSTEPESAVLSLLLQYPEIFYESGIRFYMLSALPHQLILQEIEALVERNLVPDVHLIVSSLESSGTLSKVGGKEYITYLLGLDFKRENFREYCSLVTASHKARSLLSAASRVRAEDITTENVDEAISNLRHTLETISGETSNGTFHIGDGIRKVFEDIVARTASPGIRGVSWGFSNVDMATGGKSPGDWWIIGGRPSQGKTALMCNSILSDGRNGVPVALFEKEMNYPSLIERLVAIDSGVPIQNIKLGILTSAQVDMLKESVARVRQYPIYIDTNFLSDIHYIESAIYKYKATKGVGIVYLDYLQLLAERDDNQTNELGRISRKCKLIANDQNVCVIGASQLNRSVEARENKRPILSDLRQSGNLEEDADYVVGLYRDDYYNKETKYKNYMEFIILKARNGPVGTITLKFDPESNKVEEK